MNSSALASPGRKRYLEIDFIKFAAIIFMVFVHSYEVYTYEAFFESPGYDNPIVYAFNYIIEFFGAGAFMFMFCMGLGIVFSKNTTPAKLAKRGGTLFLIGILVNFLEEILPMFWENPGLDEVLDSAPALFANDVYFFFCLTFLFFAFAFAVKRPVLVCGITCVLSLAGGLFLPFQDFSCNSTAVNLILGLFVYTNEYSFFPFASWVVYPAAGYLFGRILTRVEDRELLYRRAAVVGILVLSLATYVGISNGFENTILNALECADADFYAPNFFTQVWALGFTMVWLFLCYQLTRRMQEGRVTRLISFGSRNIMSIYVIQWLVIAFATPVLELSCNIAFTYLACTVITVLTLGATKAYLDLKPILAHKIMMHGAKHNLRTAEK